jgi:hypothetical protein
LGSWGEGVKSGNAIPDADNNARSAAFSRFRVSISSVRSFDLLVHTSTADLDARDRVVDDPSLVLDL